MVLDLGLFTTTVAGGSGVLAGYYHLFLEKNLLTKLQSKYTENGWKLWKLSAMLTVVSFFAIIVWYSFYDTINYRELFLGSLTVFLFGAVIWPLTINYEHKHKCKSVAQLIALTITTLGTIGMLIAIVFNDEDWLLITASSIVVFHHLFFDNFYWYFLQN